MMREGQEAFPALDLIATVVVIHHTHIHNTLMFVLTPGVSRLQQIWELFALYFACHIFLHPFSKIVMLVFVCGVCGLFSPLNPFNVLFFCLTGAVCRSAYGGLALCSFAWWP